MNVKKPLFALLAASTLGAMAIPAQAATYIEYGPPVRYTIPPDEPPVRYTPAPAPVVREGHWEWNGYQYVWVERVRPSYYAFRTDRVFAAVVVVALVSLALFLLVVLAARLATPWLNAAAETRTADA